MEQISILMFFFDIKFLENWQIIYLITIWIFTDVYLLGLFLMFCYQIGEQKFFKEYKGKIVITALPSGLQENVSIASGFSIPVDIKVIEKLRPKV